MHEHRFDTLVRSLIHSRRAFLGGMLGSGAFMLPRLTDAKKKRKHKKTAKPNAFGCIDIDALCQTAEQCCSGICKGKKGKKRCRSHDVGDCQTGAAPEACDANVSCTTSTGEPGSCGTTTGNAVYCFVAGGCFACQADIDCQRAEGGVLGPRAACVTCEECPETGGTACVTSTFPEA